jgi:hypothetical protein
MDFAARVAAVHDPAFCARLIAEAKSGAARSAPAQQIFWMGTGESPDYTEACSLEEMARNAGEHWSETFLRLSRESGGKGLFTFRMVHLSHAALRDLLASPRCLPILGDAGAHPRCA